MIHLSPNEKVIMILHRHWIVIAGKAVLYFFALLAPFVAVPALSLTNLSLAVGPTLFFFIVYLMVVSLGIFIAWIEYYLDAWIITTERIIDIDQRGLFSREISEFMLQNIQDITVVVPGILATFLKYGDISIQTAGEKSFSMNQIPHIYEAKNIILDYSQKNQRNVGTQQMEAN